MSIMIPPIVGLSTSSKGEREIFYRLRDDFATITWLVLHSLDTSNHVKNIAGELDFVVIVPEYGVLCVEVKGCSSLRRDQGRWFYGSDTNPDPRGPFRQASEGMHTVRNYIISKRPDFADILFWSAVIFPYIDFTVQSGEWHDWQVIDNQVLRSQPISELILSIFNKAFDYLIKQKKALWFNPKSKIPTPDQCKIIADLLRPNFEFFESIPSRKERFQTELKEFTAEQYDALDAMQENPRVAFIGPAGTGKTLLAIEAARRSASLDRKVLLLCFNKLLGDWLHGQASVIKSNIVSCTLHRHMLNNAPNVQITDKKKSEFWEVILPKAAIENVKKFSSANDLFDEVIIDEAQDILLDSYMDYINVILRGGLGSGRWRIFGDFEKQAIYNKTTSPYEILRRRCPNTPVFTLRCNCRNTPRLVELVHLLGGLQPPYSKILRPDDGIDPEIHYYDCEAGQKNLLVNSLEKMVSLGYDYHEIVVLSLRSDDKCIASQIDTQPWNILLNPFASGDSKHIGYTTIHAFKGMESPVVIVTEIEHIIDTASANLFYIAVTRALQRLTIILNNSVKQEMKRLLLIC